MKSALTDRKMSVLKRLETTVNGVKECCTKAGYGLDDKDTSLLFTNKSYKTIWDNCISGKCYRVCNGLHRYQCKK